MGITDTYFKLPGQNYLDTQILHPYVIVDHVTPKSCALPPLFCFQAFHYMFEPLMRSNTDSIRKPGSRSVLWFSLKNMQATPDIVHFMETKIYLNKHILFYQPMQGSKYMDIMTSEYSSMKIKWVLRRWYFLISWDAV